MLIQLHKNEGILLLTLMDTFKSPMLRINTSTLILFLMLKSELWLLEMGIGRPNGMLTRLCLRTSNNTLTQAADEKFRKHETNYAAVGLAVFPFVLGALAVLASTA